jgi:hypothetical protein
MSRRERISDFTRPVARGGFRSYSRTNYSSPPIEQKTNNGSAEPVKRSITRSSHQDLVRNSPKAPPANPKQDRSRVLRRNGLKKLPEFSPQKKNKRIKIKTLASSLAVITLLLLTPYLILRNYSLSGGEGVVMSARKIISGQNDEPKYLISSSIMDVPAKVEVIDSLDDQNRVLTDSNKIGWYKNSSKSGEKGIMTFVGYVSSPNNTGALSDIYKMKQGDYIQVETGDGQILIFTVKEVQKVKPTELDQADVTKSKHEDKQGLNIISYTDKSNTTNSDLSEYRYVVYATKD